MSRFAGQYFRWPDHCCRVVACAIALLCCPAASAQDRAAPSLRLEGVVPGGLRTSATESRGIYDFAVTNWSEKDHLARVLVFFVDRPDVQYGRDVWVPAHSRLSSWMLVGPTPRPKNENVCELHMDLYDRTQGKEQRIPPPTEEYMRSRGVLYRQRDPFTVILLDEEALPEEIPGRLPQPDSLDDESVQLALSFRLTRSLSDYLPRINSRLLPPMAESFDGIDHFVLASNRIARDPAGMQALRHWLEQGGKVWVMLDRVEPDQLAPLLGDALDFQAVDRVGLTSFRVQHDPTGQRVLLEVPLQKHERPVEFVRVLLPAHEQARYNIDGWPVWFSRQIGRGKVVFSTLGPRGWFRERTRRDSRSPFRQFPSFPVPLGHMEDLGYELHHLENNPPFPVEAFQSLLTEEIGYSVVDRGTVVLVFGGFLVVVLALGIGMRQSRRPELLGWLAPAASLMAMSLFIVIGERSRRAAPPTVAVAQVVNAVSENEEASIHGLMAVYRSDSGTAELGATRGGFFDLNMAGLEGQTRRLVLTDQDAWHWENVSLPAGVRMAPFQTAVSTVKPITALAHFGPAGIEGRIEAGPFEDLNDVLLATPSGRNLAVQLHPDGSFRAGSQDILPKEQFLASAVLNDRQRQRQNLFREFLKPPGAEYLQRRNIMLAWAKPIDTHFRVGPEARSVGSALLIIPLRFKRPANGERVTIPGPFLSYQRVLDGIPTRPSLTSNRGIDMHLRFQLPVEVLPFHAERARLSVKIEAPARRVTISGQVGGQLQEIEHVDSPLDSIHVDFDERFLRLDERGGLHVNFRVSDSLAEDSERVARREEKWTIQYLELEVSGLPEG
ncbi:MAG TPA: hypothetical protein VH592_09815 [Gemmataceae bacterium]